MVAIYLDHAATTPMHEDVIKEMTRIMSDVYGNPSSIHQFGRKADFELENARENIAKAINANPTEIIFNSGGTEGDNTALIQTAIDRKENGQHIISTNIEHSAVSHSLEYLADLGFEITYLPVNENGSISVEQVEAALRDDTILVTTMYGNNEVGTILPIKEIGELLKEHQALFHTDAVQAFGTERIDVKELNVDYLSISGHKINGPKGVGFLYIKKGAPVPVMLHGGEQEEKKRAGTENLSGIVGLSKAIEILTDEQKQANRKKYEGFKEIIFSALDKNQIDYEFNGDKDNHLAHILNIWFKGIPSNILLSKLDLLGFAISTGSACSAGNVAPSPVIQMMKKEHPNAAVESIRISFGYGLTESDIELFSEKLVETIKSFDL
ncbi:cysteine desulfurase family protein [Vagococcus carniphilus]|uniref:cysteine desulfurase n=1 Tax=Vagococcus carniphilus TaxID=218144 RepID=A0AAW8U6G3_9ENTE|nr:cysteine desulfurase family protein [Vagococcus carniphilus]MDT2829414.1 cysteine desulfurase family protein [Vagococcus carniphilus]MDT2833379.1 cysteine desulfurase family protein [Vagococcus carniphilus]MDT2838873.1 cysteine desulfurase family protein [Vagococcus carniphilus]MDT2852931.1 cysteine desulfurase family protein [Vagococcus carniphilus]